MKGHHYTPLKEGKLEEMHEFPASTQLPSSEQTAYPFKKIIDQKALQEGILMIQYFSFTSKSFPLLLNYLHSLLNEITPPIHTLILRNCDLNQGKSPLDRTGLSPEAKVDFIGHLINQLQPQYRALSHLKLLQLNLQNSELHYLLILLQKLTPKLYSLDLSYNHFTNTSSFKEYLPELRVLALKQCQLNEEAIKDLKLYTASHKTLQSIQLEGNNKLSQETIDVLNQHCATREELFRNHLSKQSETMTDTEFGKEDTAELYHQEIFALAKQVMRDTKSFSYMLNQGSASFRHSLLDQSLRGQLEKVYTIQLVKEVLRQFNYGFTKEKNQLLEIRQLIRNHKKAESEQKLQSFLEKYCLPPVPLFPVIFPKDEMAEVKGSPTDAGKAIEFEVMFEHCKFRYHLSNDLQGKLEEYLAFKALCETHIREEALKALKSHLLHTLGEGFLESMMWKALKQLEQRYQAELTLKTSQNNEKSTSPESAPQRLLTQLKQRQQVLQAKQPKVLQLPGIVKEEQKEALDQLLEKGFSANFLLASTGETLLHEAVQKGNLHAVKQLLANHADPFKKLHPFDPQEKSLYQTCVEAKERTPCQKEIVDYVHHSFLQKLWPNYYQQEVYQATQRLELIKKYLVEFALDYERYRQSFIRKALKVLWSEAGHSAQLEQQFQCLRLANEHKDIIQVLDKMKKMIEGYAPGLLGSNALSKALPVIEILIKYVSDCNSPYIGIVSKVREVVDQSEIVQLRSKCSTLERAHKQQSKDIQQMKSETERKLAEGEDKAERRVKVAEDKAERRVKEVEDKAEQRMKVAEDKAEQRVKEVEDKAEQRMKVAEDKAEQRVKVAEDKAERRVKEVEERAQERERKLEGEIAKLWEYLGAKQQAPKESQESMESSESQRSWAERSEDRSSKERERSRER